MSGAFAEAACGRGERTMFVCLDSHSGEVVRNLTSVGIRLARYIRNGRLQMISARTIIGSAETFVVRVKALAAEHRARCLVIDPVSALSQPGNAWAARSVAERLIDWTKAEGITLVCTSLRDDMTGELDGGASLQVAVIVDTWIHLNYLLQGGERNRGLSIIKSRGTEHSRQVRQLVLSSAGISLTDAYTAGGEVLLGALRWEKERAARVASEVSDVAGNVTRVKRNAEEADLEMRLKSLQTELLAKQAERDQLVRSVQILDGEPSERRTRSEKLRGTVTARAGRK